MRVRLRGLGMVEAVSFEAFGCGVAEDEASDISCCS